MENRNGLIVDTCVTPAHGRAEVEAAYQMLERNACAALSASIRMSCSSSSL